MVHLVLSWQFRGRIHPAYEFHNFSLNSHFAAEKSTIKWNWAYFKTGFRGTADARSRLQWCVGIYKWIKNLFALSFLFSLSLCVQLCAIQFLSLNIWAGQIVPWGQNNHSTILKFIHSHIRNNLFGLVPSLEKVSKHIVTDDQFGIIFEVTNDTYIPKISSVLFL